jgi:predicted GNAT family acetyltransferase
MPSIKIDRELTASKGRYVGRIDGLEGEAELTFSRASPKLVIADHTFAPESMRGTGAAKAMVDRLIADARAEGFKIMPLCPYVKGQFERHPDWADILYR